MNDGGWAPYVPVAKRRARAAREVAELRKKGKKIEPIEIQGRKIARTFWGEAWCNHLEKFSDYANRLPRGRTYVRNGSVCHLAISRGKVEAIVSGSELYRINIDITPLPEKQWNQVCKLSAGQIGSILELLQGRFSDNVMAIVTDQNTGLFPRPSEIKLDCDCPDWARMCKHVAAVLYGVGARLDHEPELLFLLRNVDHEELVTTELDITSATTNKGKRRRLAGVDLADVFGVEMEEETKTFTAAAVTRLRRQFGMNTSQFAKLVGVSPPTVTHWENGSGKLNLRQSSLDALGKVTELTPEQGQRQLKRK
jgi:uncharacterized Zn finger protein